MPISIPCPSCAAVWPLNDELRGQSANCPGCRYPLPVPAPPTEKLPDIALQYHKSNAFFIAFGFGLLALVGVIVLKEGSPLAVGLGAIAIFFGLAGAYVNGRKLVRDDPVMILTTSGIIQPSKEGKNCIPWHQIHAVRLLVHKGSELSQTAETLHLTWGQDAEAEEETVFDVHGLDLDAPAVAREVMQRVLGVNPQAKVQIEERGNGFDKTRYLYVDPNP
ncbi:hypothetical protein AYO44_12755 [Planctomycetaceae bacterium SCGC AG-212-F19]|nr:hypothetical protein AYO44_12755 [Planctomycetaceae bacterium SCGC AG-212-F19]